MNALQFEALKVALKQDATGYVLTVKIHPDEIPEELLRDFVGARYMVAMVRVNDDEAPVHVSNRVKKAGMLCRDIRFQDYCKANHNAQLSEAGATRALYQVCNIKSRTELNGNKDAQERFDHLLEDFESWRNQDAPF